MHGGRGGGNCAGLSTQLRIPGRGSALYSLAQENIEASQSFFIFFLP